MSRGSHSLSPWRIPWLDLMAAAALVFLFAPMAIIILFSFNDSPAISLPIRGLSVRWYQSVLTSPQFLSALKNTLVVGSATSALAMGVGTLSAFGFTRYRFRFRNLLRTITILPIALPALFLGLSLLSFFSLLDFRLSMTTVVVGHLIYTLPYFVLVANARLERFPVAIEEAARDLGASAWQTFWRVTFPIVGPSIVGAGILVFALSFDEFLITFFLIGSESTLPMLVWSMMRRSIDPRVNAISTLVIGLSMIVILIMGRFVKLSDVTV